MAPGKSAFRPTEVKAFFARLAASSPAPTSELVYSNPYTLLVAVVLSAQATDKGVNKATTPLFKKIQTPEKMIQLGERRLRDAIKTIGLFRNKAKNVIALSKMLIENHSGEVPPEREALEMLPGVGRKTANVVLNVAFGEKTIAVDTHIFRVGNRSKMIWTYGADESTGTIRNFEIAQGRAINRRDVEERREVVFLGHVAATRIFGARPALGSWTVLPARLLRPPALVP